MVDSNDQLERLLQEAKRAEREDFALAESLQRLTKTKEWQTYVSRILLPRIQSFGDALTAPSGGLDGMVRSEFLKGALCGLLLARDTPLVTIKAMEEVRKSSQESSQEG